MCRSTAAARGRRSARRLAAAGGSRSTTRPACAACSRRIRVSAAALARAGRGGREPAGERRQALDDAHGCRSPGARRRRSAPGRARCGYRFQVSISANASAPVMKKICDASQARCVKALERVGRVGRSRRDELDVARVDARRCRSPRAPPSRSDGTGSDGCSGRCGGTCDGRSSTRSSAERVARGGAVSRWPT